MIARKAFANHVSSDSLRLCSRLFGRQHLARDRAHVTQYEAHSDATETTRSRSFAHQRAGHGALAVTDAGHLFFHP